MREPDMPEEAAPLPVCHGTGDRQMTSDDLRSWGYAPGAYPLRCIDCVTDSTRFCDLPSAAKRAWRCEPCARKARDDAEWRAAQPPLICDIEVPHA
jgi:hypothetical protein